MSDDQGDAEPEARLADGAVGELRSSIAGLADRLTALEQRLDARLGSGQGTILDELQDNLADVASGEVVGALWEEVRQVRAELPASAAAGAGLDGQALEAVEALRAEVEGIGAAVAARTEPTADPAVAGMREELRALAGDVRALLDAPGAPAPAAPAEADDRVEVLRDEIAALRDLVASELDSLRQAVARSAEPDGGARAASPLDEDALDQLREEIRAAGGVADQIVESLREELKALRRRIAVKASEKVLDDQQLAQLADAVADRLGRS